MHRIFWANWTCGFPREAFEETIRASGKGVEASLRAFGATFDHATHGTGDPEPVKAHEKKALIAQGPDAKLTKWKALAAEAAAISPVAVLGLQKVVSFQDTKYGREYLARVRQFHDLYPSEQALNDAASKYIANAMCYDDIIRVADLKTRCAMP